MSNETTNVHVSNPQANLSIDKEPLIMALDHVNLLVPPQTLHLAQSFYAGILGLVPIIVPASSKAHLAWFRVGSSDQQIHITSEHYLNQIQMKAQAESPRHICLKIPSEDKFHLLQRTLWTLYETGGEGAPVHCDQPGEDNTGQGVAGDFPKRFFARDYAGNRLEFSL